MCVEINHTVEFKGPLGKLEYLGNGQVSIAGENRQVGYFLMICGGSGITPIFQVLRAAMEDVEHPTKCVVLDGNRLEEDILCREELDFYAVQNPEKLKLVYERLPYAHYCHILMLIPADIRSRTLEMSGLEGREGLIGTSSRQRSPVTSRLFWYADRTRWKRQFTRS